MEFSNSDKTSILIKLLEHQVDQMHRKEQREQHWFEWATGLLLAAFGALIAFSDRTNPLPYPIAIKAVATALIAIPATIAVVRVLGERHRASRNAWAIERIEKLLHLFEGGYYGIQSPYPSEWAGSLAHGTLDRKTPIYYAIILLLLTACVVTTIWIVL